MKKKGKKLLSIVFSLCMALCLMIGIVFSIPEVKRANAETATEIVKVSGENFVSATPVTVGGNLRTPGAAYGIFYENGKFTTTYQVDWERSAILLSSAALSQNMVKVGNNYVETNTVRAYLGATFNYTTAGEYQTIGIMFGKRVVGETTTYYGLTVEPGRGYVGAYCFDVDASGNTTAERSGPFSYTPGTFNANTDYKIEILLDPVKGITVNVGGTEYANNMTNVYECNDSMLGLTPVVGLNLSSVAGTVSGFELVYENGTYEPEDIWTMEYARDYKATDLVSAAPVTVGENLHRKGNFGITYTNGAFVSSTTNVWERSLMALHNDYLDTESVIKNGAVMPSSSAMYYSSAVLNWSSAGEFQSFGVFFGKLKKETVTTYYGFLLEPGRGIAGVYTLDVDGDGNPVAERSGPLSYVFGSYSANTDYKVELLMKPTGLTVYIGGELIVQDIKNVYESNDTLVGLTPVIGLNYCSVSGSVSDFVFKYLDGAEAYIDYTVVKNTKAENIVDKDEVVIGDNLMAESDYGIYLDNGKFYSEIAGNGESAAFVLENKYLDLEKVKVNGEDVDVSNVVAYVSANLKYYELSDSSALGIVIGKKANTDGVDYYAIVASPEEGTLYLVAFKNNADGTFVKNSVSKVELTSGISFEAETMFTLEAILNPELGISVYFNGDKVVENYVDAFETTVTGMTPLIGYFWQDINATSAKLNLKYLGIDAFQNETIEAPEETYPEEGERPAINTQIIIPEIDRPSTGCTASLGGNATFTMVVIASAILIRKKRRN